MIKERKGIKRAADEMMFFKLPLWEVKYVKKND
jgi:hypothetical protein